MKNARDEDGLNQACYAIAQSMLPGICSVAECQRRIEKNVQLVLDGVGETSSVGEVLVPSLHFIAQTVAGYHSRDDSGWFGGCLEALLEVADPSCQLAGRAFEYLQRVAEATRNESAKGPRPVETALHSVMVSTTTAGPAGRDHKAQVDPLPATWVKLQTQSGEWLAPDLFEAVATRIPHIKLRRNNPTFVVNSLSDGTRSFMAVLRWGHEKAMATIKSREHETYLAALDEVVAAASHAPADDFDPRAMVRQHFEAMEHPTAFEFINVVPVGLPRFICKAHFGLEPKLRTRSSVTMATRREAFISVAQLEREDRGSAAGSTSTQKSLVQRDTWWEIAARHGLTKPLVRFSTLYNDKFACTVEWQLPTGTRDATTCAEADNKSKAFEVALALAITKRNSSRLNWKQELVKRLPKMKDAQVRFGEEGDGHTCFVIWASDNCCKGVGPSQLQAFEAACERVRDFNAVMLVLDHSRYEHVPSAEQMARAMRVVAASVGRWTSTRASLLGSDLPRDREKLLDLTRFIDLLDPHASRRYTSVERSAVLVKALQDIAGSFGEVSRKLRKESLSENMRFDSKILTAMLGNSAPPVPGAHLRTDASVIQVCEGQGLPVERAIESMLSRGLILRTSIGALRLDAAGASLVQEVTDTRIAKLGSLGMAAHGALVEARTLTRAKTKNS